jgi:hypothetical protein
MTTTILTILRPNGSTEKVDISAKWTLGLKANHLKAIADATKAAGRGVVVSAEITETHSNAAALRTAYNNLHNEGADGYVPEAITMLGYREWTTTTTIKA